jgi:acyl carrier protein
MFLWEQHNTSSQRILMVGAGRTPDTRKSQPTETVVNSTQIRALSPAQLDHVSVAYTALRVRIIVADHLSVDFEDISDSSSFTRDLGANSLDSAKLLLALEEEFHCEFSDEATDTIHTVGDAIYHLIECNRHQTPANSLANSAKNYWLKSVKFS